MLDKITGQRLKKHKKVYSECLLRLGVLRVILLFCAFVFVRPILS